MKQVCRKECQVRQGKRIVHLMRNQVIDYDGDHACLTPLDETHKVDFSTANRAELRESEWTDEEAVKAVGELYNVTLDTSGTRKDTVEGILDARLRSIE